MTSNDGPNDPTLPVEQQTRPMRDDTAQILVQATRDDSEYELGAVLGRGGMGEVVLAHERRFGRDVALKRLHAEHTSDGAMQRFLREAMIQACLEHPAIVPVHDLGRDATGRPYFTMKRVVGTTLHDLVRDDASTTQRLLRAIVDVCMAIDLAHSRGVVHRDLKPSNVMLGDFGEVYVLDWGIARILGNSELASEHAGTTPMPHTHAGALIGTPGYMAPEQARGEPVGPAADIYSIGAMLFEALAREPLHPDGAGAIASTLSTSTASPAARRPDRAIAPELDEVCTAALAASPDARPSARALGDRIQQYLDGDRDLERRRTLAAEQLAIAKAALASGEPHRRGEAMHTAGRALALDPESREAAALVSKLLLEPPAEPPPGLLRQIEETELELIVRQRKFAAISILAYFLFLPLLIWMGVTSWPLILFMYGVVLAIAVGARIGARVRSKRIAWAIVGHVLVLILLARVLGPFVLVPGLIAVVTMSLVAFPTLTHRMWAVIAAMTASVASPLILEATDVLSRTWEIQNNRLVLQSAAVELDPLPATVFLVVTTVALIVIAGLFARTLAAARRDASRRIESQAWHLAQLLPQR